MQVSWNSYSDAGVHVVQSRSAYVSIRSKYKLAYLSGPRLEVRSDNAFCAVRKSVLIIVVFLHLMCGAVDRG
jgi:hypothetical protein